MTIHGKESPAASVLESVLTYTADGNAVSGIQIYGRVCTKETEYCRSIHCDTTDSGPLRGDGADAGDMFGKMLREKEGLDLAGARAEAESVE